MTDDSRQAPLAMDAATFRALGHRLVDQLAESLDANVGAWTLSPAATEIEAQTDGVPNFPPEIGRFCDGPARLMIFGLRSPAKGV